LTRRKQSSFIYCWAELRKALAMAGRLMITVLSNLTGISDTPSKAHWDLTTDFNGKIPVSFS